MHSIKKMFTGLTGYWIYKESTLPIGTDINIDIHKRVKYGPLRTIFDVGANIGQTWEWLRKAEPGSKIFCFEPVSNTFRQLKEKTQGDLKCVTEQLAFGNQVGSKVIKLFDEHSALNSLKDELMNDDVDAKEETVSIDTIDNYCRENKIDKIDFLKIDTEGYEITVLQGAEGMLDKANVSFIFCEIGILKRNTRNTNLSELTEWLAQKNYYFLALYQMVTNGWKQGEHFGNALFVHKDIFNP